MRRGWDLNPDTQRELACLLYHKQADNQLGMTQGQRNTRLCDPGFNWLRFLYCYLKVTFI